MTRRIAEFIRTILLPEADVALDLHSGGSPHEVLPSVMLHFISDREQFAATYRTLSGIGAPALVLIQELEFQGLLDAEAIAAGKVFGCGEFGGGGALRPATGAVARACVRNLLSHLGVLTPGAGPQAWGPVKSTMKLLVEGSDYYFFAPQPGFYEPLCECGAEISEKQPVGNLYDVEEPWRAPHPVLAGRAGRLYAQHVGGWVEAHSLLGVFADVLESEKELWARYNSHFARLAQAE